MSLYRQGVISGDVAPGIEIGRGFLRKVAKVTKKAAPWAIAPVPYAAYKGVKHVQNKKAKKRAAANLKAGKAIKTPYGNLKAGTSANGKPILTGSPKAVRFARTYPQTTVALAANPKAAPFVAKNVNPETPSANPPLFTRQPSSDDESGPMPSYAGIPQSAEEHDALSKNEEAADESDNTESNDSDDSQSADGSNDTGADNMSEVGWDEIAGDDDVGFDEIGASPKKSPNSVQVRSRGYSRSRKQPLGFTTPSVAAGAASTVAVIAQTLFRGRRLSVSAGIASSFTISDIKVGNVSQLAASGELPADAFLPTSVGEDNLTMDTCSPGQSISITVTNTSGTAAVFRAALFGDSLQ